MKYITGTQKVINNLMMARDKMLARMGEAVEKTCVDVANHAKAGHAGNQAHMNKRYRNQTSTLTRSIMPELVIVSYTRIEGVIFSNIEYAPFVELGTTKNKPYPYLYPALLANMDNLKNRLVEASAL